jgi:hypothetical protein
VKGHERKKKRAEFDIRGTSRVTAYISSNSQINTAYHLKAGGGDPPGQWGRRAAEMISKDY